LQGFIRIALWKKSYSFPQVYEILWKTRDVLELVILWVRYMMICRYCSSLSAAYYNTSFCEYDTTLFVYYSYIIILLYLIHLHTCSSYRSMLYYSLYTGVRCNLCLNLTITWPGIHFSILIWQCCVILIHKHPSWYHTPHTVYYSVLTVMFNSYTCAPSL